MSFLDECISFTGPVWQRYLHHPWIDGLFAGTLTTERFEYWLIQDLPYLGEEISSVIYPKVPPHNPWRDLNKEYQRRAKTLGGVGARVELQMLERYDEFAVTRWAARPRREAFINFWTRTIYEGTFGDICCAWYVCNAFTKTFGDRYLRERPSNLTAFQIEWIEQWIDPFHESLRAALEDGINEYGTNNTEYECKKMKWIFLRSTQHQIGTFDAAWNLSDPWPGEGEELGILADSPSMRRFSTT